MDLLKELCEMPGIPGYEDRVQDITRRELEKCCDEVTTDRVGNVYGLKKGAGKEPRLKVMFAAHTDEIGLMVKHIDDDGFIHFVAVGGLDPRVLAARRVIIHGREDVRAIIAPLPIWLGTPEDRQKSRQIDDLVIDTGRPGDEVKKLVRIGDPVSLDEDFQFLNDKIVTGRNFDNRMGVYCLLAAMARVKDPQADIYAVCTVQEEVGLRGAWAAAFSVEPDIGIAIDGSLASDIPYAAAKDKHCSLGQGTGIYIWDRLTIGHPKLINFLTDQCEANNIAYQRNMGGGTDAAAIQKSRGGAIATTIGAPTRYMHSNTQLCHVDDIEATIQLIQKAAENAHTIDINP